MDYKNMAVGLMSNPWLQQEDSRPYQLPNQIAGQAQGWSAQGIQGRGPAPVPYNNMEAPKGQFSSYPKNEVDLRAIINQILQGMQRPKRNQSDLPTGTEVGTV